MSRPTVDQYFMDIAGIVSSRATCIRRQVGCVLVNFQNHIIGTGYNGNAPGFEHCIDNPCGGADYPSGEGLNACEGIHAEVNAIVQCKDAREIETVYCTTAPCMSCTKMLLTTGAYRIVYKEDYASSGRELWLKKDTNQWEKFNES